MGDAEEEDALGTARLELLKKSDRELVLNSVRRLEEEPDTALSLKGPLVEKKCSREAWISCDLNELLRVLSVELLDCSASYASVTFLNITSASSFFPLFAGRSG